MKKFKNSRLSTDSRKLQTLALKICIFSFIVLILIFSFDLLNLNVYINVEKRE